jgi:D-alanine-D-alanine ligase
MNALLHNAATLPSFGASRRYFEEFDTPETIAAIAGALHGLRVAVEPVEADRDLPWRLQAGGFDFVFNIAEGRGRRCREGIPAAVCELLGIPFTGSDMLTLAVTLDKAAARRLVSPEVPVARAVLVEGRSVEMDLSSLTYPVIVKPNDEGSSKGIHDQPIAVNPSAAAQRARWLQENTTAPCWWRSSSPDRR